MLIASAAAVPSSKQRSIGNGQAGKVADHRLEVQQAFQAALGNLRLVRRVLRVPSRVFKNVAQDDARRMGIVIALADIVAANLFFSEISFSSRRYSASLMSRRHVQLALHADGMPARCG